MQERDMVLDQVCLPGEKGGGVTAHLVAPSLVGTIRVRLSWSFRMKH